MLIHYIAVLVIKSYVDSPIAEYEAILKEAPALSVCYLRVAEAYGTRHDYESVLATYVKLLKIDPANADAKVGMAMTNLEKGDMKAAGASKSREIYYNLGELKLAAGDANEAAKWYQKAADTDPSWSKPSLKLALLALQKGNKQLATQILEKAIATDRVSPEAAQAVTILAQVMRSQSPNVEIAAASAPQMAEVTRTH